MAQIIHLLLSGATATGSEVNPYAAYWSGYENGNGYGVGAGCGRENGYGFRFGYWDGGSPEWPR